MQYSKLFDLIPTSKEDKVHHGYGLRNIRMAVAINRGNCYIESNDDMFHITVALPLK